MTNLATIMINGQEYIPVMEGGIINGFKRFNVKYGMWVEIKPAGNDMNSEEELLDLLKNEYIRNATKNMKQVE